MNARQALTTLREHDVLLCNVYPWAFRLATPLRVLSVDNYPHKPSRQADDMAYFTYCETMHPDLGRLDELILAYIQEPGNGYLAQELVNTAQWLLSS